MKVGTDGVLIGAWSDVSGVASALDVGTGCGLIALMLAQRAPNAVIDAIDIDHDSVEESKENFKNSPWGDRLQCVECDFMEFGCGKKHDLIVSNPPFFGSGPISPRQSRGKARHNVTLTYDTLLKHARDLLSCDGKIAIVSPVENANEILECCNRNNLYINRLTRVVPVQGKEPKRLLWEITKHAGEMLENNLVIKVAPDDYSDEFRSLCGEFYLQF